MAVEHHPPWRQPGFVARKIMRGAEGSVLVRIGGYIWHPSWASYSNGFPEEMLGRRVVFALYWGVPDAPNHTATGMMNQIWLWGSHEEFLSDDPEHDFPRDSALTCGWWILR